MTAFRRDPANNKCCLLLVFLCCTVPSHSIEKDDVDMSAHKACGHVHRPWVNSEVWGQQTGKSTPYSSISSPIGLWIVSADYQISKIKNNNM
uniref:Putative secreted protein n=1 Tax=Ixodes ricinus TaxID=34613 RepID=A0A6B0UBD0_IXORI